MTNAFFDIFCNETMSEEENLKNLIKIRGLSNFKTSITTIEGITPYFEKDSIENFSVEHITDRNRMNKWAHTFASNRYRGNYISPLLLEPFVARYVIVLNNIGIKTFFSCDGWHNDKNKNDIVIGFRERNSLVWHKIVTEIFDDDIPIEWEYDGYYAFLRLPKYDKEKLRIYKLLNLRAESMEKEQEYLFGLKVKIIDKVKNMRKNSLTNLELEIFLKNHLKDIIK